MDRAHPLWDGDEPDAAPHRRRRALVTLAVLPWLALVVVTWRSSAPAPAAPAPVAHLAPAAPAAPADPVDPAAPAEPAAAPDEPQGPPDAGDHDLDPPTGDDDHRDRATPTDGDDGTRPPVTDGDAATVAIAVARAWLADRRAPDLTIDGIDPLRNGYLEHVSVRRIEVIGADGVVVTVGALLLEREDGSYARVRAVDVLVPLTLTAAGAHPAGPPWWAPTEVDLTPRPPAAQRDDDPDLREAVATALRGAGYRDLVLADVARAGEQLLVARISATTAAGDALDGEVWLRDVPGAGPTPLGTPSPEP